MANWEKLNKEFDDVIDNLSKEDWERWLANRKANRKKRIKKMKDDYVKSTESGRLYIETEDFFKQPKIQDTIKRLLNSDIVKGIEERKKNKRG